MHIYKITNTINGKIYVGQTTKSSLNLRLSEHISQARAGAPWLLQKAIRKYGSKTFIIESIFEAKDKAELQNMETYFILLLHSNDPHYGYNMNEGGKASHQYWSGKNRSLESIAKGINTRRKNGTMIPDGWNQNKKIIEKRIATRKAKGHYNPANIGQKRSEETKQRMSIAQKANPNRSMLDKHHFEESKQKSREKEIVRNKRINSDFRKWIGHIGKMKQMGFILFGPAPKQYLF